MSFYKITPLALIGSIALASIPSIGRSLCADSDVDRIVAGTFEIVSVSKAKVRCTFDESKDFFKTDTAAKIAGCSVVFRDPKTQKNHTAYAGSIGCSYKPGRKIAVSIHYSCCGDGVMVACSSKSPHRVLGPPSPASNRDWFCAGFNSAFVVGAIKE